MRVLIIAGGTGGHIFPALVLANALTEIGMTVEWLGAEVGMEKKLVGNQYPLHLLPIQAVRGKGLMKKLIAPFRILHSVFLALKWIRKINPDVVIGMGGYASGPGGIAAWLLGKPLMIHEQNAIPGLTNRILFRFARIVFQAFPKTFAEKEKVLTVGNPVRPSLYQLSSRAERFESRSLPIRVLVLGGSQGAHAINEAVQKTLPLLTSKAEIIFWHQTGERDFDDVAATYKNYPDHCYKVAPFIEDMASAYTWADLVVCRAGALTVSEVMASGIGSVLVPYPYAVDDHQTANAKQLCKVNAGILLPQEKLTADALSRVLLSFYESPKELLAMAEQAQALAKKDTVATMISAMCRAV